MTKTRKDFEPDNSPKVKTPEQEKIHRLSELINNVCGLNKNWAKACLYYCMATHKLNDIQWMPNLEIVGQKGSGKSRLMDILCALCCEPYRIIGHQRITSVTLRNELGKAENKTAIIEEGDLFPNRKELESYLINCVDKKRTAQVAVTVQNKNKQWETIKFGTFGATILHDRHEMVDMAADRRSIVINIKHQKGKQFLLLDETFLKILSLPSCNFGKVPDVFNSSKTTGPAFDTWEPLIRIANSIGDDDWLGWAKGKIVEMTDGLADGQQFEMEMSIFSALVQAYCNTTGIGLMPKISQDRLPLSSVTEIVKIKVPEPSPGIHPIFNSLQITSKSSIFPIQ